MSAAHELAVERLRRWLIRDPKPSLLRVHADGDVREVPSVKPSSWKHLAETVIALGPEMVEAMDDGKVLRATRLEDDETAAPAPFVQREVALPSTTDPETLRMHHFATLIASAYQHSHEVAFDRLVQIVEMVMGMMGAQNQRLERLEAAYRREANARLDDLWDHLHDAAAQAQGAENPQEAILSALLQGAMAGRQARKPNGSPPANGKGE